MFGGKLIPRIRGLRYTTPEMRVSRLRELAPHEMDRLFNRRAAIDRGTLSMVQRILAAVRQEGDAALVRYTQKYDRAPIRRLDVPPSEFRQAEQRVDAKTRAALRTAWKNVVEFHRLQKPQLRTVSRGGVTLGTMLVPFGRAGLYAPGGRAAYPTTVLMAAAPARVAGVGELVLCTPPRPDGKIHPIVLYAARIAGIERVFRVGGAQAIAAMAFGTRSVPPCEIIVGPGNRFVTAAKKLVSDHVAIDFLAGPTEILILSDGSADPDFIAHDLAAQAEHDPDAVPVFVTTSERQAIDVFRRLPEIARTEPRSRIIGASLGRNGQILLCDSVEQMVEFANRFAPEHLVVATRRPDAILRKVRNAGSIFLGEYSACAFGDYGVGPNHILPTMGEARRSGALSPLNFLKAIPYQKVSRSAARRLLRFTAPLAAVEGLHGHGRSMQVRVR